jgi:hypothetical protein
MTKLFEIVRFQVVTVMNMNMTVFWDAAACSMVDVNRRFRDACCFHQQGDRSSVNVYQTARRDNPEDSHLRVFCLWSATRFICLCDRLERLLRSVDSRKPQFIGQAGRGNQEEFGLLSLEYDENFCMGGPGVLLSRETLARVAPHVKTCLRNMYTTHEDVELGRCVQKFAGIPCTWSYEVR